jgi:hypothetical protein
MDQEDELTKLKLKLNVTSLQLSIKGLNEFFLMKVDGKSMIELSPFESIERLFEFVSGITEMLSESNIQSFLIKCDKKKLDECGIIMQSLGTMSRAIDTFIKPLQNPIDSNTPNVSSKTPMDINFINRTRKLLFKYVEQMKELYKSIAEESEKNQSAAPAQAQQAIVPPQTEQAIVPAQAQQAIVPAQTEQAIVPPQTQQAIVPPQTGFFSSLFGKKTAGKRRSKKQKSRKARKQRRTRK